MTFLALFTLLPQLQAQTAPLLSGDKVVAAAGDIACDPAGTSFNNGNGSATKCKQKATAALLAGVDAVLPLGDTQYECAGTAAFSQSYNPTWGQYKNISYPAIGNHEYYTSGGTDCSTNAAGYFGYFGKSVADPLSNGGYYSWNLGSWHFIVLNSECGKLPKGSGANGCAQGSPQDTWLEGDLAGNTQPCIAAYWHRPRYSSNGKPANASYKPFWADLYAYRADIVLNGHAHFYEKFKPQDENQAFKADGIREFIVGTGGDGNGGVKTPLAPNEEVNSAKTYGVLKITLHANGYDYTYVPIAGQTFTDSGTNVACH